MNYSTIWFSPGAAEWLLLAAVFVFWLLAVLDVAARRVVDALLPAGLGLVALALLAL